MKLKISTFILWCKYNHFYFNNLTNGFKIDYF